MLVDDRNVSARKSETVTRQGRTLAKECKQCWKVTKNVLILMILATKFKKKTFERVMIEMSLRNLRETVTRRKGGHGDDACSKVFF